MRRPALRSMPRIMQLVAHFVAKSGHTSSTALQSTDFRDHPPNVRSQSAVACGHARESGCDGVSPVAASMYCSPHPAALHIAPAAGSGILPLRFRARRIA